MRGFGLQRQRPVADQLRIAAVLLRKIGRWMPQYAVCIWNSKNVINVSMIGSVDFICYLHDFFAFYSDN